MLMQNFADCEMREATFLQEVAYVWLKCLGFIHFTQEKHSRLERLTCFALALRNSGKQSNFYNDGHVQCGTWLYSSSPQ